METGKGFSVPCAVAAWEDKVVGREGCPEGAADTDLSSCIEGFGKWPLEGTFRKETSEIVEPVILHTGLIPLSGTGMLVSEVLPDAGCGITYHSSLP